MKGNCEKRASRTINCSWQHPQHMTWLATAKAGRRISRHPVPDTPSRASPLYNYVEVAKALEGIKGDAVIDGEFVAIGKDGVSHFQLLQNALRHEAKLQYCAFDLMFENAVDLRKQPLLERKKRLKAILPRDKLIAFSAHRKGDGTKFFAEAERKGLEGLMAKRADSAYTSGSRNGGLAEDQDGKATGSSNR